MHDNTKVRGNCSCILGYAKMNMDMYCNSFKIVLSDISSSLQLFEQINIA